MKRATELAKVRTSGAARSCYTRDWSSDGSKPVLLMCLQRRLCSVSNHAPPLLWSSHGADYEQSRRSSATCSLFTHDTVMKCEIDTYRILQWPSMRAHLSWKSRSDAIRGNRAETKAFRRNVSQQQGKNLPSQGFNSFRAVTTNHKRRLTSGLETNECALQT